MSPRILLEVALRILGLWLLFTAIVTVTTIASWYLSNRAAALGASDFLLPSTVASAVELGLGVVLVCWAPGVAAVFYPLDMDQPESPRSVGPGDVYHTACFVLGAYLLVGGVDAAGRLAVSAFSSGWQGGMLEQDAVPAIVYTASGLVLIFGSRRIGQMASSLGYDPESIPQQQFSLKLLLILTGVVAVILGVIRMISVGGL